MRIVSVRMTSWLSRSGLLSRLLSNGRLALRLIREPRVPRLIKTLPLMAVLYIISPLDLAPDVLPLLGQIDDLGVLLIALEVFLRLCPPGATVFHQASLAAGQRYSPMSAADDIIDAEWHRE